MREFLQDNSVVGVGAVKIRLDVVENTWNNYLFPEKKNCIKHALTSILKSRGSLDQAPNTISLPSYLYALSIITGSLYGYYTTKKTLFMNDLLLCE